VPLYHQLAGLLRKRLAKRPPGQRFLTEREISGQYKVSRATVCRAINRLVSQRLLYRIQGSGTFVQTRHSEEQARRPNVLLFLPRSFRHYVHTADYVHGELVQGVIEGTRDRANLVLHTLQKGDLETDVIVRRITDPGIDGVVLFAWRDVSKLARAALSLKKPFVLLNVKTDATAGLNRVLAREVEGMKEVLRHLWGLGHRRFLFVGPSYLTTWHSSSMLNRYAGFQVALEEIGGPDADHTFIAWPSDDGAANLARALGRPNHATVVIVSNDPFALEVLEELKRLGLQIPDDVSVVGFDDGPGAATSRPRLTTVRKPRHEMGVRAADMVLSAIETGFTLVDDVYLETDLIVRDSTAPPKDAPAPHEAIGRPIRRS